MHCRAVRGGRIDAATRAPDLTADPLESMHVTSLSLFLKQVRSKLGSDTSHRRLT